LTNKFAIPRLDYVVFELVKIDAGDYLSKTFRAEAVDTVFLTVLPESFRYSLQGRDAITQTDSEVFKNKFDFAPERCVISGSFLKLPRMISGTFMDGWSRLRQFEQLLKDSKKVTLPKDGTKYLYELNYYDFMWQRFGNINVNSYSVNGDSRINTSLERYSAEFIIAGPLIDVLSTDYLLEGLKLTFATGGMIDFALQSVNGLLASIAPDLQIATLGIDALTAASGLAQGAESFLSGYSTGGKQVYQQVASLF
jgi:hypothetical protein